MARDEYIGYLIARTHKVLKKRLTTFLNRYDLTVRQHGVLNVLYEEDGLPARELVVRLFSDSSTIMDIIDRLEEKDLVKREADPQDRRVNRIFLTDKARILLPKIKSQTDRFEQAVYRRLLPQEIDALKTGLNKLCRLASGKEETVGVKAGKGKS
ncbi:MAG: MarR family transcriptional regulator [Deltaproteobacteria bacterium]|nr:MarR family transcriptional regulator [Deltaproteobacteria bacterium]